MQHVDSFSLLLHWRAHRNFFLCKSILTSSTPINRVSLEENELFDSPKCKSTLTSLLHPCPSCHSRSGSRFKFCIKCLVCSRHGPSCRSFLPNDSTFSQHALSNCSYINNLRVQSPAYCVRGSLLAPRSLTLRAPLTLLNHFFTNRLTLLSIVKSTRLTSESLSVMF